MRRRGGHFGRRYPPPPPPPPGPPIGWYDRPPRHPPPSSFADDNFYSPPFHFNGPPRGRGRGDRQGGSQGRGRGDASTSCGRNQGRSSGRGINPTRGAGNSRGAPRGGARGTNAFRGMVNRGVANGGGNTSNRGTVNWLDKARGAAQTGNVKNNSNQFTDKTENAPKTAENTVLKGETTHLYMPSSVPDFPSTGETTNYAKVCRLLVDVGTQVFRQKFNSIYPKASLEGILWHPEVRDKLERLKAKGVLNPLQWGKLYPAVSSSVSSKDFDISLLMKLFRNICGLSPPATGWDKLPPDEDVTLRADIARITWYRNHLSGHPLQASVDDVTFTNTWMKIRTTLVRVGGAAYGTAIDNLKNQTMDPASEEHYKELLRQWKLDDDSIKDKLDKMEEMLNEVKAAVCSPEGNQTVSKTGLERVHSDAFGHAPSNSSVSDPSQPINQATAAVEGTIKRSKEMPSVPRDVTSPMANVANLAAVNYADNSGKECQSAENKKRNLLHSAAEGGVVSIIETMLSLGFDVNSEDSFGTTPLMLAAAKGNRKAVDFLISKGANPSLKNSTRRNLLHAAVEGGDVSIVEMFLSNIPIDSSDNDGVTSLMIAASDNNLEMVKFLLRKGADPFLKTSKGNNVLFISAQYGHIDVIAKMCPRFFHIDSPDDTGCTPLMCSAAYGKLEAVNYLLEKGADPLLRGKNGRTLLHYASQGGNTTIIKTILSYGLDIDIKDTNIGLTPLMVSVVNNNQDAIKYLLEKGADPSLELSTLQVNSLQIAVTHSEFSDVSRIIAVLSSGLSINMQSSLGQTALMVAAFFRKSVVIDFLLREGADPLLKDTFGRTVLHYASEGGDVTIIDKFLSCGLHLESKDNDGNTP